MSEYLDKTYIYIKKNFIRFGILLLIIGAILMIIGLIITPESSSLDLKMILTGGFVFLSGSLFVIASFKPTT